MKRALSILLIGLMFFTALSTTFSGITSGGDPNTGRIYGYTNQIIGWEILPVPFALVTAGCEYDISDIYGYFELNDLPLGEVYEVKANKIGYNEISVFIELTVEEPEVEVNFLLTLIDAYSAGQLEREESTLSYVMGS